MKKALIVWGGWKGHNPKLIADRIGEMLEESNYNVKITCDIAVLINEDLKKYDVIVPVWSCGIKSEYYSKPLLEAVRNGVGLATFHGGIKWFEDEEYYNMIGALYLFDSKEEEYAVTITEKKHSITAGLNDFNIISEKYYMQVDPSNHVLMTADFAGVKTPVVWIKNYGKGRIFYSTLAHSSEQIFRDSNITIILNGIKWCSNK